MDMRARVIICVLLGAILAFSSVASFRPRAKTSQAGIRLYQLAAAQLHASPVYDLAFSPSGQIVATGSGDGTVQIGSSATLRDIQTLGRGGGSVWKVVFSPDGHQLAASFSDAAAAVQLWDVNRAKLRLSLIAKGASETLGLAYSADGKLLATGSDDGIVRVWDSATGTLLNRLIGHKGEVSAVAFSPQGTRLASAGRDGTVRIWAAHQSKPTNILHIPTSALSPIAFSPDGKRLAIGSRDGVVKLWDVHSKAFIASLALGSGGVVSVQFTKDGRTLGATGDTWLRVWDATTGSVKLSLNSSDSAFSFVSAGSLVALRAGDYLQLWDYAAQHLAAQVAAHSTAFQITASRSTQTIATWADDGTVKTWTISRDTAR